MPEKKKINRDRQDRDPFLKPLEALARPPHMPTVVLAEPGSTERAKAGPGRYPDKFVLKVSSDIEQINPDGSIRLRPKPTKRASSGGTGTGQVPAGSQLQLAGLDLLPAMSNWGRQLRDWLNWQLVDPKQVDELYAKVQGWFRAPGRTGQVLGGPLLLGMGQLIGPDGRDLGQAAVREGRAVLARSGIPDLLGYGTAQEQAKQARRGVWATAAARLDAAKQLVQARKRAQATQRQMERVQAGPSPSPTPPPDPSKVSYQSGMELHPLVWPYDHDSAGKEFPIGAELFRFGWLWLPEPEQISVEEQSDLRVQPRVRGQYGVPRNQGHVRRRVELAWSFMIPDEVDRWVRYMIGTFQLSPFLPIQHGILNYEYGILALALHRMTISVQPGTRQPNRIQVTVEALEFDALSYLPWPMQRGLNYPIYEEWVRQYVDGQDRWQGRLRARMARTDEIDPARAADLVFQIANPEQVRTTVERFERQERLGVTPMEQESNVIYEHTTAQIIEQVLSNQAGQADPWHQGGLTAKLQGQTEVRNWSRQPGPIYVTGLEWLNACGRGRQQVLVRLFRPQTVSQLLKAGAIQGYIDLGSSGSTHFQYRSDSGQLIRWSGRGSWSFQWNEPVFAWSPSDYLPFTVPGIPAIRFKLGARNSYAVDPNDPNDQVRFRTFIEQRYLHGSRWQNCLWLVPASQIGTLLTHLKRGAAADRQPEPPLDRGHRALGEAALEGDAVWITRRDGRPDTDQVCLVAGVSVVFEHNFTEQQVKQQEVPTFSYLGSVSGAVQLSLEVLEPGGLNVLQSVLGQVRDQQRQGSCELLETEGFEVGFVRVHQNLLNSLGVHWLIPQSASVQMNPGGSELRPCQLTSTIYQPLQVLYQITRDRQLRKRMGRSFGQPPQVYLEQLHDVNRERLTFFGLNELLDEFELYPDLHLPTYQELAKLARAAAKRHQIAFEQLVRPVPVQRPFKRQLEWWTDKELSYRYVDPDFYLGWPRDAERKWRILSANDQTVEQILDECNWRYFARNVPASGTGPAGPGQQGPAGSAGPQEHSDLAQRASADELEVHDAIGLPPDARVAWTYSEPVSQLPADQLPNQAGGDPGSWAGGDIIKGAPPIDTVRSLTTRMCTDYLKVRTFRLVRAFPTFYLAFYNEGRWIGHKRLWDHFFSGITLSEFRMVQDQDEAADLLTLAIYDYEYRPQYPPNAAGGDPVYGLFDLMSDLDLARTTEEPSPTDIYRWEHTSDRLGIQPGTRVHFRYGYGSRASELPVKFNGRITEYQPQEGGRVELVCQGDGCELLEPITNRLSGLGAAVRAGMSQSPFLIAQAEARDTLLWLLSERKQPGFVMRTLFHTQLHKWYESLFGPEHFGPPVVPRYRVRYWPPANRNWCLQRYYELNAGVGMNIYCMGDRPGRDRIRGAGPMLVPSTTQNPDAPPAGTPFKGMPRLKNVPGRPDPVMVDEHGNVVESQVVVGPDGQPRHMGPLVYTGENVGGLMPGAMVREPDFALDIRDKSIWDVANELADLAGDFICAVHPFEFRSTLFYGKPYWDLAYGYIYRQRRAETGELDPNNILDPNYGRPLGGSAQAMAALGGGGPATGERIKPFSQIHCLTDVDDILVNNIQATENFYTNLIGIYTVGDADYIYPGPVSIFERIGEWLKHATTTHPAHPEQTPVLGIDPDIRSYIQRTCVVDLGLHFTMGWLEREGGRSWLLRTATSRLVRSVGFMYDGSLILRGNEYIKPHDLIYLSDMSEDMRGWCRARRVIQQMNVETGFVTEIVPAVLAAPRGSELSHIWVTATKAAIGLSLLGLDLALGRVFERQGMLTIGRKLLADREELLRLIADGKLDADHLRFYNKFLHELAAKDPMEAYAKLRAELAGIASRYGGEAARHARRLSNWLFQTVPNTIANTLKKAPAITRFAREARAAALLGRLARGAARLGRAGVVRGLGRGLAGMARGVWRAGRAASRALGPELLVWMLMSYGIDILIDSIQDWVDQRIDRVVLIPLERRGRPFVAGVLGHRGLIVGETPDMVNYLLQEDSWLGVALQVFMEL